MPRDALILLVRGYRFFLSPWLGSSCRFEPTCSAYSMQALERHGAIVGALLTVGRIARCHPWCTGGHEPVPSHPYPLFSRLSDPSPDRPNPSLSREKNTP
ncbi:MAG: membrane protein insertion efficiency factor YidD [Burkholderiales bacterium]|nr:membrane protein insertion efficiency factor YidD [Burkholderiales bacterium]